MNLEIWRGIETVGCEGSIVDDCQTSDLGMGMDLLVLLSERVG
jgi:hypothetical protein